jgi:hypothetical protein
MKNENISPFLESKFYEALKVFNEMTRENPNERPTCEEILTLRNAWALNEADIENSGELMDTILSKKSEEIFTIYSLF